MRFFKFRKKKAGRYKDREGNLHRHEATPEIAIRFMYRTVPGRFILKFMISPGFSNFIRFVMCSRLSSLMIDPFAKKWHIRFKDYVPVKYKCYNDFFTRIIKDSKRPIEQNENLLASPCDGKIMAYRISPGLVINIKNTDYSIKSLTRNHEISEEFAGGYCMIIRLTVDNYHRYCYPDDGYKSDDVFLPGVLHTVSAIAMEHANIYAENQRMYTVIDTKHFGRMVQMEVGALGVGRIINWDEEGEVQRGIEKGLFEFGGSTVVLLLKSEHFTPDEDILKNSAEGYETIVKMGERIGYNEKYKG